MKGVQGPSRFAREYHDDEVFNSAPGGRAGLGVLGVLGAGLHGAPSVACEYEAVRVARADGLRGLEEVALARHVAVVEDLGTAECGERHVPQVGDHA